MFKRKSGVLTDQNFEIWFESKDLHLADSWIERRISKETWDKALELTIENQEANLHESKEFYIKEIEGAIKELEGNMSNKVISRLENLLEVLSSK